MIATNSPLGKYDHNQLSFWKEENSIKCLPVQMVEVAERLVHPTFREFLCPLFFFLFCQPYLLGCSPSTVARLGSLPHSVSCCGKSESFYPSASYNIYANYNLIQPLYGEVSFDVARREPVVECVHKSVERCHYTYTTQFEPHVQEVIIIMVMLILIVIFVTSHDMN